ncbi:MAG: AAA family ATPase [Dehalococcoidales bacterium]|nr:AAA family ATPase [Dehalococcoidales bacterium]
MLQTGVPNLDLVLGGGLSERDVLLLAGPPGAGKTTLCLQIAFQAAAEERNVLYVSTPSEPPNRLLEHARSFSFCDEVLIGRRLFTVNIYPLAKQSLEKVADGLIQAAGEREASLVILDGLMTVGYLHPDAREVRAFLSELGATFSAQGRTTIITSSREQVTRERAVPEATMVDAILELGMEEFGTQAIRTVQVRKARGLAPLLGQHSLRIDKRGLAVSPRLEALAVPSTSSLNTEKMPLGLPELDAMMEGGLPAGSVTLLAGALGTGKTLTCLHFLAEGARRGEPGLLVGFRENPELLIAKAQSFGLDLRAAVDSGLMHISYRLPIDLVFDDLMGEVWQQVEHHAPRRLVIDSITDLQEGIVEGRHQRGLMSALSALLRAKNVTSIITKEIAQVVGPELDFSDTPLAVLAENLLLLRYVEFHGDLYRILSIIKMRDSRHDHSIRQYVIDQQGLNVLGKMETAEGVLTGIARLPGEARVKRREGNPRRGDAEQ